MTHPTHWPYQQFVGAIPPGDAQCYLCGVACPAEHSVIKGIADTFNSHWLARCPSSPWLCAACAWYLDNKVGHPDFRKMSLMVWETGWKQWDRAEMKQDIVGTLQHGTGEDVYLVCSLSKKKHILLQAPLNAHGTKRLAIQVEEQVAYVDRATWGYMDHCFMRLLELGHNKGEILSGNLYQATLKKHGRLFEAMELSDELQPYRDSAELTLLSYVTIVEEQEQPNGNGNEAGDNQASGTTLNRRVEQHRPRIQEPLPSGNLAAISQQREQLRADDQRPGQILEPSLWDI